MSFESVVPCAYFFYLYVHTVISNYIYREQEKVSPCMFFTKYKYSRLTMNPKQNDNYYILLGQ